MAFPACVVPAPPPTAAKNYCDNLAEDFDTQDSPVQAETLKAQHLPVQTDTLQATTVPLSWDGFDDADASPPASYNYGNSHGGCTSPKLAKATPFEDPATDIDNLMAELTAVGSTAADVGELR